MGGGAPLRPPDIAPPQQHRPPPPSPGPRQQSPPPGVDAALPGWVVMQRTTQTGRSYKVYHGPRGEYAESRRQALLLASGEPRTPAQLAPKCVSLPPSRPAAPATPPSKGLSSRAHI